MLRRGGGGEKGLKYSQGPKKGVNFLGVNFFSRGGFRPPGPPRLESLRSGNGVASLRDGKYFIFLMEIQ